MLLIDQKADVLLSKISFAEKRIKELDSLDKISETYIEGLTNRLNALKDQIITAQSEFREFIEETSFVESDHLRATPQRELLKDVLRTYEEIEQSFYLGVDTFLPLIPIWIHQRNDKNTKRQHGLLVDFVQRLVKLSAIPEDIMTIIGEAYECLPLYWGNATKHVIFITYSEIESLRRWVLLTHEVGHAFYDLHFQDFNSSVIPQVMRKLFERRPLNITQREYESIVYIWTRKWIPELVSDCFSVKTLGPPYAIQFMLMVLDSEPDRIDISHPPDNLRINFMMDLLESMALPDFYVDFHRGVWNSYSRSITRPSSQYILDEEVVETALSGIDAVVRDVPVRSKWTEILSAREALSGGNVPEEDLVPIIAATALLDSTFNLDQIYERLLERHASSRDAH